jgi:hypothetical protein
MIGESRAVDPLIQSQAPYRLATPQWMSQIRAQDWPAPGPHMFGFPGSQVPIPEGSQVPTRETERVRCPRSGDSGWGLYPRCHFPANCLGVSHRINSPARAPGQLEGSEPRPAAEPHQALSSACPRRGACPAVTPADRRWVPGRYARSVDDDREKPGAEDPTPQQRQEDDGQGSSVPTPEATESPREPGATKRRGPRSALSSIHQYLDRQERERRQIEDMLENPAMRIALDAQERRRKQIEDMLDNPALRAVMEAEERQRTRIKELLDNTAMRAVLENQERQRRRMEELFASPAIRMVLEEQQRRQERLNRMLESSASESVRRLVESTRPIADDLFRVQLESTAQAAQLRHAIAAEGPSAEGPSAEQEDGARETPATPTQQLLEVTAVASEQIASIASFGQQTVETLLVMQTTSSDALEESRQLRQVISRSSSSQESATKWLIGLTVTIAVLTIVLVGLTYLLVAEALDLWPFAAPHTSLGSLPALAHMPRSSGTT